MGRHKLEEKVCRICGQTKTRSEFESKGKDRVTNVCKVCNRPADAVKSQGYRERHREAGLCLFCSNPARPGLVTCGKCKTSKGGASNGGKTKYDRKRKVNIVAYLGANVLIVGLELMY